MTAIRGASALALAAALVFAGCSAPVGHGQDPFGDPIGWEGGYWYNDPIHVTPGDGYNQSERAAVVSRTMARVERIRDLEFRESVPVEVVSRAEYRNQSGGPSAPAENDTYRAWNDQVWEALFLVGEDRHFADVYGDLLGASVQGYYSPSEDAIVIVSDSDTPTIDRQTLSHELVHALQDQHFSFGPDAPTQDQQLAHQGLTEGDANYVMQRYEQRCQNRWDCIPLPPAEGGGGGGRDFPLGVFVTIYQPYASGPSFVGALRDRGGWDAVDAAYGRFPVSTEQVIHPQTYPDERPVSVTVPDRSRNGWTRFDVDPAADTVGEASIYAMMQANGQTPGHDTYDYDHPISAGWAGDAVYPYRNGDRYGYVWRTAWDTESDAREFLDAYRGVLRAHGATRDGDVYVIPDSDPFGDAFRVTRSGTTVTVVNAPTRDALDDVHPR
ncbi:MAG: Hvo_1808 family surface protein [Haloarculaceae archaeon]